MLSAEDESVFRPVLAEFVINDPVIGVERIGSGHINDSWLVSTTPDSATNFVLQRINHHIFRDVESLTNNILKVTRHLQQQLLCKAAHLGYFRVLKLIPTRSGAYYKLDPQGNYWRLYEHVRGSRSYDIVENTDLAYEGGKAFGIFQFLTSGIDATGLHETIANFHNIAMRFAAFRETVKRDPENRADGVRDEIAFAEERAQEMHTILRLGETGMIPLRVTHNDTKFNNILFDDTNRAICIVDLDTVMPGYSLYDFGDAIRTGTNTGAEDEADLEKVGIDLQLFDAYTRGYLEVTSMLLTPAETDHLVHSAIFMTFIIGLRFLTDHIDGDHYYRTRFPGHNLQRARAQFKLVESMEMRKKDMLDIISKYRSLNQPTTQ
jgi:Ser/Thr protein kinase RdoA (MazF antagonist)